MTHSYAPRSFLRHAPNALLARYFHEQNLLRDLDIAALPDRKTEPLFVAWDALPEADRTRVDHDFQLIHDLADAAGVQTILAEARVRGDDLEPLWSDLPGFHDKVLWTFLERRSYIDVAERFHTADRLPARSWLRRKAVPLVTPREDSIACLALASGLADYFHHEQGRGRACIVDAYRRADGAVYYFAYPEDYGRVDLEFAADDQLERRPSRPAFEVVFRYDPDQGTLDTYHRGSREAVRMLNRIFGQTILGVDLHDEPTDERVYELDRFAQERVRFLWDASTGLQSVVLQAVHFTVWAPHRGFLVAAVPPNSAPDAIYAFIDRQLTAAHEVFRFAFMRVTKVTLRTRFAPDGRARQTTRTFTLSCPNGCNLRHEGRDAVLRQMLIQSGIEPLQYSYRAA